MKNLLSALMTKFTGSAVSTAVGGRIYFGQAPDNTTFPYIVFFNIPDATDGTFTEEFENYQIQFSIFSSSQSILEIANIYADLETLLDDCELTITDNTLLTMGRLASPMTTVEEVTTAEGTAFIHHWSADYSIMLQVE